MSEPTRPDFSLTLWKPMTIDQFILSLHNMQLEDGDSDRLINRMYDFQTGEWATVFFRNTVGGPTPVSMILHREDEDKTKLLYFTHL